MLKKSLLLILLLTGLTACATVGTLNLLTSNDPGAKRAAHDIAYGEKNRQSLDIYVPEELDEPAPVMMFIYGGSWRNGSKKDYSFVGHAFAARGFVTVLIDYRLVPEVTYPAFIEDAATGFAWVHENIAAHGGNPDHIFISGQSAGAYNAVMLGLAPEFLAVHGLKPTDISGIAGIAGPYDFFPFDGAVTQNTFGSAEDPQSTQPVNRVAGDIPPMLLVAGLDDERVQPRNTRTLAELLEKDGYNVKTAYYEGVDHAESLMALSALYRNKAPILEDIIIFTRQILMQDAAP